MGISQDDIDNIAEGEALPPEGAADNSDAVRGKLQEAFKAHLENIFGTLTGEGVTAEAVGEDVCPGSGLPDVFDGEWLGFLGPLELTAPTTTAHLISLPVVKSIVGKIMGQDPPPETLDEAHIGTMKETANNLLGAWATGLGELLSISAKPSAEPEILEGDGVKAVAASKGITGQDVTYWRYNVKIGDVEGQYAVIIPSAQMQKIIEAHPEFTGKAGPAAGKAAGKPRVEVEKAVFQEFEGETPVGEPSQIELLLDVPLTVSVELGRKRLPIKDILDMVPGSLLELDKLAGEPVDLMMNGKLFARGEVVVIDENFGVRIANIVSPKERLESLK